MNQSQLKYARERAEKIYSAKRTAIVEKHTTEAVEFTTEQKIKAIKDGAYTVDKSQMRDGWRWADCIRFKGERNRFIDNGKVQAETKTLDSTYRKLMDELILGDNEKALELLRAFEA